MLCPKCRHPRTDQDDPLIPDYRCPACGIVYAKFGKTLSFTPKPKPEPIKIGDALIKASQKTDEFRYRYRQPRNERKLTPAQALFITISIVTAAWMVLAPSPNATPQSANQKTRLTSQNKDIESQQRDAECQLDANCSAKKAFTGEASVNCQNSIEHMAKYRFKWTDGWLGSKFGLVIWKDVSRTILHAAGGHLELENGFGAWQPYRYICEIRIANGQILAIQMAPGRL